jgi:hypothetical protein
MMKWLAMALCAVIALVGCRSSQPATNPFMRTTVAPPATTAPAVVMPGESFSPGVVPGPAVVAPPPMATPGFTPAPVVAPPVVAPPVVAPPRDKYSPPGGSFQYNQSSNGRPPAAGNYGVQTAAYREPTRAPEPIPAVAVAGAPAAISAFAGTPGNQIRIVPASEKTLAQAAEEPPKAAVRQAAPAVPEPDDEAEDLAAEEVDNSDSFADAEPVETIDPASYGYAPDYAWLRGRLEYSPTMRQWKLRYIPIDGSTDQFGGSVKLPESPALTSFKPGDLVTVRGALSAPKQSGDRLAPQYAVAQIAPVAR